MTGRRSPLKGYRVTRKNGKVIVEPTPNYGLNASAKAARQHSKRVRVGKRVEG
jgi:hypothetical protein